ncbi:glycosyltransferase family 32 protein [Exiguobacterium sp. s189]|uniref:glycosyltransferase family 32 protein n=1 Tax=Exiguobacterium sp. s189 TaxID=2751263 RepID=UPI001BE71952|nr:glycosyltransferase [Exiguobacterium sp. s189]
MIDKKIHYCWFGKGTLPPLAQKCIASWKKNCPDYEIIEWNEDNFDINSIPYVKEAYKAGKYAFVSDYVRLYVLYNEGGIYMDTDVEVIKPLDQFLTHSAFTGMESDEYCVTGIIGSVKEHPWIKSLLQTYSDKKFKLENGQFDISTNTELITRITTIEYNWLNENRKQILKNDLSIYPFETFCAKDWRTGLVKSNDETFTIHHFSGSWIDPSLKGKNERKAIAKRLLIRVLGEKYMSKLLSYKKQILNFLR